MSVALREGRRGAKGHQAEAEADQHRPDADDRHPVATLGPVDQHHFEDHDDPGIESEQEPDRVLAEAVDLAKIDGKCAEDLEEAHGQTGHQDQ